MNKLENMRAFVTVAQTGSFSKAANLMRATQSSISKKVVALERHLQTQLLLRNAHTVRLTDVGRDYYLYCSEMLQNMEDEEARILHESSSAVNLRVTLSPVLSRIIIAPLVPAFLAQNPGIHLSFGLTEESIDILKEGFDLAIRAGHLADSNLKARKLSSNPLMLAASPAYLKDFGVPEHPKALKDHRCLGFTRFGDASIWKLKNRGQKVDVTVGSNFDCDQGDSLIELAASGYGIVMLPEWTMREHLRQKRLVPVLPEWDAPALPIHLVYPNTNNTPTKIRRFIDFVVSEVGRMNLLPK